MQAPDESGCNALLRFKLMYARKDSDLWLEAFAKADATTYELVSKSIVKAACSCN